MVGLSRYNPEQFDEVADRSAPHAGPSGYETTQTTSYTTGQSGYALKLFGLVANCLTRYAGPFEYVYTEPGAAQYA